MKDILRKSWLSMPNHSTNCPRTFPHWLETSTVSHKILILVCLDFFLSLCKLSFFFYSTKPSQWMLGKDVGKPATGKQVYFLKRNCYQEPFFFFGRESISSVFCFVLLHLKACRMLDPRHGTKAMPPAVEAWSPDHWTTREFPVFQSL